jgi:eukaryotic-like serine/threonine-protein kinase
MKRSPPSPGAGPPPETLAPLLEGTAYRAISFLGAGGMGAVWMVEHRFLRKRFALKVLHAHQSAFADRMRLEAQSMGRVNHPGIVEVVDFWISADGRPCLLMELLEGCTLWDELSERGRLPVDEALDIVRQILSALVAAHGLGIVHRDLKPENIFLHEAPGLGCVAKLLDFGIARVMPNAPPTAPSPAVLRTVTGEPLGSYRFMSPEAWNGAKLDARADLYSLGLILYVMLAGQGPFDAGDTVAAPPSKYAGSAVAELDAIILKAIQENPGDRYQSAAELLTALRPWLRQSIGGTPSRR